MSHQFWHTAFGDVGDGVVGDGVGDVGDGVVGDDVGSVGDGVVGDGVGGVGVTSVIGGGVIVGGGRWGDIWSSPSAARRAEVDRMSTQLNRRRRGRCWVSVVVSEVGRDDESRRGRRLLS